jgi:hypothetical protein
LAVFFEVIWPDRISTTLSKRKAARYCQGVGLWSEHLQDFRDSSPALHRRLPQALP